MPGTATARVLPPLDGTAWRDPNRRRSPMSKADDALAALRRAEAGGQVSAPAAANLRRWLTEPPFARYRDRLIQDIDAGRWQTLDDAFYAVLEFGTGGRRGKMYPVGTNV